MSGSIFDSKCFSDEGGAVAEWSEVLLVRENENQKVCSWPRRSLKNVSVIGLIVPTEGSSGGGGVQQSRFVIKVF